MKVLLGVLFILAAIALGGYLGIYLMLYGGIMGAINNWGVNTSAVVWNIIRAVFFEAGFLPSWGLIALGIAVLASD